MKKWMLLASASVVALAMTTYACIDPEDPDDPITNYILGWLGSDNMNEVQTNVTYFGGGSNLPSSVNLVPKFPPIGDQNPYGTCVAWAVAYNYKTAINGMEKGYTASQLSSPSYQFSPKDLFTAIPNQEKGSDCNGTDFVPALTLLQERGVATLQTVPYTSLNNCSASNVQSSWTNEANNHKIQYWRKIQADTPEDLKALLADNIPIVFGAKLSDNFMTWNSEAVLSSNSSYQNVGQHAYHAMVLAGYDDSKQAFKIINSWGTYWGSQGYIWIEYDFFLNEFCINSNGQKALFMAVNQGGNITPPDDPDPVASGVDLAAWVFDDYQYGTYQGYPQRVCDFNIYNIGNQTANANKRWSAYGIVFNAYDANDYGVLFSCEINPDVAYATEVCADYNNCTYNVNIPSGSDFGTEFYGTASSFPFAYAVPFITGYYYLCIYVDPQDVFTETDETNNVFYPYDEPLYFIDGLGVTGNVDDRSAGSGNEFRFKNTLLPDANNLKNNDHFTLIKKRPNAYRSEEIAAVIKASHRDGRWASKLAEMNQRYSQR